jgi:hypothetical protein
MGSMKDSMLLERDLEEMFDDAREEGMQLRARPSEMGVERLIRIRLYKESGSYHISAGEFGMWSGKIDNLPASLRTTLALIKSNGKVIPVQHLFTRETDFESEPLGFMEDDSYVRRRSDNNTLDVEPYLVWVPDRILRGFYMEDV